MLLILGSQDGISFNSYGEKDTQLSVFIPRISFSKYFVCGNDDDKNEKSIGFCVKFSLFIDFLYLSLIRGNRPFELTSWLDLDYVSLQ